MSSEKRAGRRHAVVIVESRTFVWADKNRTGPSVPCFRPALVTVSFFAATPGRDLMRFLAPPVFKD